MPRDADCNRTWNAPSANSRDLPSRLIIAQHKPGVEARSRIERRERALQAASLSARFGKTAVAGKANKQPGRTIRYFRTIRVGVVAWVGAAGEIANVNHTFPPAGRLSSQNST